MSAAQRLSQVSSHVASKAPLRVSVIGSGNWGNALAKIVAENTAKQTIFSPEVKMWMYEETIQHEGKEQKITEVFNRTHENVKSVIDLCHVARLIWRMLTRYQVSERDQVPVQHPCCARYS